MIYPSLGGREVLITLEVPLITSRILQNIANICIFAAAEGHLDPQ